MKKTYPIMILIGSLVITINLFSFFIFTAFAAASDFTLGWDANGEDDLEGYAVYKKESPTSAFTFIDTLPIDELEDPSNPSATITELEDDLKYYFAVTAYDIEGNESDYSKELCVQVAGISVTECSSEDGSSQDSDGGDNGSGEVSNGGDNGSVGADSVGGGGGGGGCFIVNARAGFSPKAGIIAMVIMMGLMLFYRRDRKDC
jgi:hypothetical protein